MSFIPILPILKRCHVFIFRDRGREGEREGAIYQCARETLISCLSHTPSRGPGLQLRHVPCLGTEQVAFQLVGRCATH